MSGIYNEDYYKSNNYENYIRRGTTTDHYELMVDETLDLLKKLNRRTELVLDFGCGPGFLLEQLTKRVDVTFGVDISEYSRNLCKDKGLHVNSKPAFDVDYDVMYALDVLEHLDEDDLTNLFEQLSCDTIVYKLPVAKETGGEYVLDCAEADETHQIRWTHNDWRDFFSYYGYTCIDVKLTNIYVSEGGFCGIAIK
jgi:2-polyprenyl-3-methyl-5-hydroxy-6-metoxy-1,4-benzoquinol methylase